MINYMECANAFAEQNLLTNNGGPFGAVIVKNGVIVGTGSNNVIKNNDPTAHAEVQAIRDACKNLNTYDLTDCVLYASCYPCPMCLSAIIWANIKTVYFGYTKEDAAEIGFRDDYIYKFIDSLNTDKPNEDVLKLLQLDRDVTIQTFEKFKNKEDKTIY